MTQPPLVPMFRALAYLQAQSFANNLRVRFRRLKQPKYLVGALVGLAYVGLYLGQTLRLHGVGGVSVNRFRELMQGIGALGVLIYLAGEWILPGKRAVLKFTETELAFLLPAPLTRRALIHFKLLKSQVPLLFTSALFTLIGGRGGSDGTWLYRWIGWWCVLFTLNLHALGSSFVLTRLLDRGLTPWPRRFLFLGGLGAVAAGLGYWAWSQVPGVPGKEDGFVAWRDWLTAAVSQGPVHAVLTPFRWVLGPWFARDGWEFARSLPPALLLLGLHYLWVLAAEVSFEEASLAAARKRSELQAVVRRGQNPLTQQARKPRRPFFALAATGFPPVALVWKNLIATGSGLNRRMLIGVGLWMVMVGWGFSGGMSGGKGWTVPLLLSGISSVALVASLFFGPQLLRGDFRQDYECMDVLKTFPIPGWQVVLGQLVSPAILLTVAQWALLGILAGTFGAIPFEGTPLSLGSRLGLALGLALLLPGFNLLSFVIPNALILVFPAWVHTGKEGPVGIEVMGQRLLVAFGTLFVLLLGMVPASLLVAAVIATFRAVSIPLPLAFLVGGAAGLVVFLVEFAASVWLLGRVFERFDLTRE
jgi:hypothetical protein